MKWYAVHILMGHFFKEGAQKSILVFENVVLISASNHNEAETKARAIGHAEEGDSQGSLKIGNRPAYLRFVGIRKIILCTDPGRPPGDGVEIACNEYEFPSQAALDKYASGQDVLLQTIDCLREDKKE